MTSNDSERVAVSEGLNTVLRYLTSIPAWYLATSVNDQPHVRPFSFAAVQDGKLWFCTATTKGRVGRAAAKPAHRGDRLVARTRLAHLARPRRAGGSREF